VHGVYGICGTAAVAEGFLHRLANHSCKEAVPLVCCCLHADEGCCMLMLMMGAAKGYYDKFGFVLVLLLAC
jgi:hypothetical protein